MLPLERLRPDASTSELLEALWPLLTTVIRGSAKGKAAQSVLREFLENARPDVIGAAQNDRIEFHVRSPGGLCAASRHVTEHWLFLAVLVLRPQLGPVLEGVGFRLGDGVLDLHAALERSPHAPIVVIKGVMHAVGEDGALISDEDAGAPAGTLTAAERKRVAAALATKRCECPMCEGLRKSRPTIDIAAIQKRVASVRSCESLRTALANADQVQHLFLDGRIGDALTTEVGRLRNLETLRLGHSSVCTLPASLGELRQLRELDISTTGIEGLPDTIGQTSLENLNATHGALRSLPPSLAELPLRVLRIGFGFDGGYPSPDGFLPVLSRLTHLEWLELSDTPASPRPPVTDAERAVLASREDARAQWVSAIESFDFSRSPLKTLHVSGPRLTRIPPSLADCPQLTTLDVRYTPIRALDVDLRTTQLRHLQIEGAIESIPAWLGSVRTLRHLSLSGSFTSVPEELFDLCELEGLGLNGRLEALSERIGNLRSLKHLWLWNPSLSSLPAALANLPALEMLSLRTVPNARALVEPLKLSPKVRVLT